MRSISEVGSEILGNAPKPIYFFLGDEYGIKCAYIESIKDHYQGVYSEAATLDSVLSIMKKKQMIPLQPQLYVVRYDETFVASLTDKTQLHILQTKIIGTIVCLYEDAKACSKIEKYLPDMCVYINKIDPKFNKVRIEKEFPKIAKSSNANLSSMILSASCNYNQARLVADSLSRLPESKLNSISQSQINFLTGHGYTYGDSEIKLGVAARDFKYLCNAIEECENLDGFLYNILYTLLEMDKLLDNPKPSSDYSAYIKSWNREDIYYMFVTVYELIKQSRSSMAVDMKAAIIQVCSLLAFTRIPSPEVLK